MGRRQCGREPGERVVHLFSEVGEGNAGPLRPLRDQQVIKIHIHQDARVTPQVRGQGAACFNQDRVRVGKCVPARIVWTRFCNSGRLSDGIRLTGFEG